MSETVETVFISPKGIMDADAKKGDNYYRDLIVDGLSELLSVPKADILAKSKKTHSQYEVIKKNVDEETADKIA